MGVSALCMLSTLPKESKLFSTTLKEHGLEFSFIRESYPQLIKIVGNDLDMSIWPSDMDWKATDVLFIDSEHSYQQLKNELSLYIPLIGKDTVVLLDDIHLNEEMFRAWLEIEYPKLDISRLHKSEIGRAHV